MSEEGFYNQENPQRPEHNTVPEHTLLPEYNPVYPDVTFFKESSVTTREENIFQGEPPAGEARRISREQKRKERERYSLLQKLLGHASIKTTMDRYVHVTDESMESAIRLFENGENGT